MNNNIHEAKIKKSSRMVSRDFYAYHKQRIAILKHIIIFLINYRTISIFITGFVSLNIVLIYFI